jgi:hypothetical protein
MNQEQEKQPVKKAKSKSKPKPKAKPKSEFPIDSPAKTPTKPKAKIQPKPQVKKESRTIMTESPITGVDYKTIEVDSSVVSKMEAEVVQTELYRPETREYWEDDSSVKTPTEPKEANDKAGIILFVVAVTVALLAYLYFTK